MILNRDVRVMYCKKCGKEIAETLKNCDACGEPVAEATKQKKNKKLIGIIAVVIVAIILFSSLGSNDDNPQNGENVINDSNSVFKLEDVKAKKSGDNYVFDITFEEFCEEMSEVVASMYGGDKSEFIDYCKEVTPVERTIDYYSGNLDMYTIGLESSEYSSSLMVLKAEVYVEPETEKIVCVSVFKAKGSSTLDNFNMLANKASLIFSGKIVADMDDCLIKTVDESWKQTHYFECKDCGLTFEQQKDTIDGGDMRRLTIYPADSYIISE